MTDDAPVIDLPLPEPTSPRPYLVLCVLMLLALTALLGERVPDVWSALPLAFGVAFLVIQWRDAPALVLLLVAVLLASEGVPGGPPGVVQRLLLHGFHSYAGVFARSRPLFDDFLVAAAFLVYAASHYRLVGLMRNLFPLDPRVRPYGGLRLAERRRLQEEPQRRSTDTVTAREYGLLAVAVPLCVGGAAWLWPWTIAGDEYLHSSESIVVSLLKLLYLFGVPLVVFRAALVYTIRCRAGGDESLLYLQEQLWRETRREQSRANRWLTWARLRAQRRKEKT
jgi:hypothetical protein